MRGQRDTTDTVESALQRAFFFVNVGATVRVWGLCGEYTVQDQTRVRSVELCIITNIIIIIIIIVKHPTWRE